MAPLFHPAIGSVMPVRRTLGVRTIFNLLGPLLNPAGARRQVLGVYARDLVLPMACVLKELGTEHALVVHGLDGLDELTVTGPTFVAEVRSGEIDKYEVRPEEYGLSVADDESLAGGSPAENAKRLEDMLDGAPAPYADVTVLNAGAAVYVAGLAPDLGAGVERARAALASGAARDKLAQLRQRVVER